MAGPNSSYWYRGPITPGTPLPWCRLRRGCEGRLSSYAPKLLPDTRHNSCRRRPNVYRDAALGFFQRSQLAGQQRLGHKTPISAERNSATIWDETAQFLPRKSEDLRRQGGSVYLATWVVEQGALSDATTAVSRLTHSV